ncbi:MAG TPA: addiction module protein [Thermoanaerobaculia bacterium]|nr:addiction module protein [Thermoanaerobaculia bacterium]
MPRVESVLQEALRLSPEERADLAAELLASLDGEPPGPDNDIERTWGAEIERRARGALAGKTTAVPWHEVKKDLENRLLERAGS